MNQKALETQRRLQDYRDRKAQGLLTDEEKLAEINTQIFNEYVDKVGGVENIVPEELDKLFVNSLDEETEYYFVQNIVTYLMLHVMIYLQREVMTCPILFLFRI